MWNASKKFSKCWLLDSATTSIKVYFRIDPDTGQDQLAECMKRRLCFEDFHEQKIGFMPTYKFNPNSKIYDTSRALRQPSYTVNIFISHLLLNLSPIFRTEYCIRARHNVVGYFTIHSMIWLILIIVQFRPFSKFKFHLSNPVMPRKYENPLLIWLCYP